MFDIKEELKKLPEKPGVYLMKDINDQIIYIGKAKILKNRVRQYFQSVHKHPPKVFQMVENIDSFEIIITDNELEALILECNLIKRHKPKYNILLRDDKYYPYIKITLGEEFPRLIAVRSVNKDKAKYYGPFSSMTSVKETIELCRKLFKLRNCPGAMPRGAVNKRPCLYSHIGQCDAPCAGKISKEEYGKKINGVIMFLEGKQTEIISRLKNEMAEASEKMEFEKAAEARDLINSLKAVFEKQKTDVAGGDDRDVAAFARSGSEVIVQLFFIRNGKMLGGESFLLLNTDDLSDGQLMAEILKQFYAGGAFVPKEVITYAEADDAEIITEWLSKLKGAKVSVVTPKKGEKLRLAKLACENAEEALKRRVNEIKREYERATGAMEEIQEALGLESQIVRAEAYDISNLFGFENVGSMVVFENGKPKRSDYRKFRIKSVGGANDYASMHEVLTRRFSHGIKEQEELSAMGISAVNGKFTKFPDIIMIDGGKAQVGAAKEALGKLSLDIPVCGMVKDSSHRTKGIIFNNKEIYLKRSSEGFKLLTRIQDEVHRFSVDYHRKLREKAQVRSEFDDIKGVGDTRRKLLQKHFPDIDAVRSASYDELCGVKGIDKKTARSIFEYFHPNEVSPQ